jgi:hypothetical protein
MSFAIWTLIQKFSFPKRAAIVVICAIVFGASLAAYVMLLTGHAYLMRVVASLVPALLFLCPLMALYPTLLASKLFERAMKHAAAVESFVFLRRCDGNLFGFAGPARRHSQPFRKSYHCHFRLLRRVRAGRTDRLRRVLL